MLPDRVSNPGPLTYESGALPIALRGPAMMPETKSTELPALFLDSRVGISRSGISFAPEFQCCYFCEPSCLFYLSFNFDFYVSKIIHL